MGLVRFGGGVVQISGAIGGDVFARNRFGNYNRARTKPTNPNSTRQIKIRAIMGQLTTRWGETLTQAQRDAWDLYGDSVAMLNRLGESIHLTGHNHYIRSNSVRIDMAQSIVDAGPTTFTLPAKDGTIAVVVTESDQKFEVTFDDNMDWASEDGAFLYFLQGSPQNVQRNFFNGPWRGMRFLSGNSGAPLASPLDLGALIPVTEGQKVWAKFRIVRADGRISGPFQCNDTVGA